MTKVLFSQVSVCQSPLAPSPLLSPPPGQDMATPPLHSPPSPNQDGGTPPPPHTHQKGPGWLCGTAAIPLAFTEEDFLVIFAYDFSHV